MSGWITITAWVACALPGVSLPAVAPAAPPSFTAVTVLAIGTVDAGTLDAPMRDLIPILMKAALESNDGYDVSPSRQGASQELDLSVAGRGPWRLSARLEGMGEAGRGERYSSKKHAFTDRESLTFAVDALASEINMRLRPGGENAPLPVAQALSGSTKAVDAYAGAVKALRSGDASAAGVGLDAALASDRSFCLAAAERMLLDLTAEEAGSARRTGQAARGSGACRSPRAEAAMHAFELLAGGDAAGALGVSETMLARNAASPLARTIHGMALVATGRAGESRDDWKQVTMLDPDDPRGQWWLGASLMASGDFPGAAEAFGRVNKAWPKQLKAWTLRAEAQARMREPGQARETLAGMKAFMTSQHVPIDADERNPDLMLGSVDLLEGHTVAALKRFEASLDSLEKEGAPPEVVDTLHNAVIEMRRDLIISKDPVVRRRQIDDTLEAIDRYQSSQTPEHRLANPWELARLRGLISIRQGSTVDAWKIVDEIKSHAGEPGYSEYYEAYLSAAILLKEGDETGSAAQFERAAKARDRIVDWIDVAQMQGNIRKYDASEATFTEIARRLERYDLSAADETLHPQELILVDPHLAAMVPIYHYTWARLAFETNKPAESRRQFNHMLKYLKDPDEELVPLVKEAYGRGATPE